MSAQVLIVDADRAFADWAAELLRERGHPVETLDSARSLAKHLSSPAPDLVVVALAPSDMDGLAVAGRLRELDPQQEIILVSARGDLKAAQLALHAGVADVLVTPLDEATLALAVERALERAKLRRDRARLLDENQEHQRHEALSRVGLELLSSPDLEWLQDRMLVDLTSLADAQTGALWVADERGELRLKAYRGLLDRNHLPEQYVVATGDAARVRAGEVWVDTERGAPSARVPLLASGELLGMVQLSDPLGGGFSQRLLGQLKMVADFAAVAVRNARRFLSLQRLSLRDRETAAYNLSYFTDYASKEIYKARRYGRTFSLLIFSIDNVAQIRTRLGPQEARRAHRSIIRALSRIIRDSDVLAKATEQEFYLLLPETDYFGALMFLRRATQAVRDEPESKELEARMPLGLVAGAATFPKDGEDFDELVLRGRRRMDERRLSLQRVLQLDRMPFWDEVEVLLGGPSSPRLPVESKAEPSRRGKVADVLFDELQAEMARELKRDPYSRGLLYVGGPDLRADLPVAIGLEDSPADFAFRVYALGRRRDLDSHPAVTPVFLEGDERLARHEFLLWLSESSSYALLQRRGRGATWGFHTSDTAVVEGLVSKLQAEYDLQPY